MAAFVLLCLKVPAQTLFTYGNSSVSVQEFKKAFAKNNNAGNSKKAVEDYLELYIASRLKIKEAKERGYADLPQAVADFQDLREQMMPAYLYDKESVAKLVEEAFYRGQKDIHLAHIFIPFTAGNHTTDTAAARQKGVEAYQMLQNNEPFDAVAKKYSADPSVQNNGGDIGYITVFSLPYELENLAYATGVGHTSPLFQSAGGFHIFKNLGERKALGKVKVAQILLAFPPDAADKDKRDLKKLADSLFNRIEKGDDFEKLAEQFSNDLTSATVGGHLPEFGIGQYDSVFEKTAFSLSTNNPVSRPFVTAYGYHLIKLLEKVGVNTDINNTDPLKEKVEQSDRMTSVENAFTAKVLKAVSAQVQRFLPQQLWMFSDSLLKNTTTGLPYSITDTTPLIRFGDAAVTAGDWLNYAKSVGFDSESGDFKPYDILWNDFLKNTSLNYYKDNLEYFNPNFKAAITELQDGNMIFEFMQREVWTPSQTDTAALKKYFNANASKYVWGKSADAVIFYVSDSTMVQALMATLKKAPLSWRTVVESYNDKVTADSSRFEQSFLLANRATRNLNEASFTSPQYNAEEHIFSFAYIFQLYNTPLKRSFEEARGLVMDDYSKELDKLWIQRLKEKYPVTVNKKALEKL